MERLFLTVLNMSLTGAFVIAAICAARLPLKKAPKFISYALWAVAGFRLVCPVSVRGVFSLLPFRPAPIPQDIAVQAVPRINSGIRLVDNAVSAALPAAAPAASMNPLQGYVTVGSYLWLLGAAAMLVYSLVSIVLLRRGLRGAVSAGENLYEADGLKTPFVVGLFKPRIYLPAGLSGEERHYIVAHERVHIRRHDHAVKLLAYLVLCLHWFNPLAWVAFVLMGADMEMSCDERVMRELGPGIKCAYSRSLVQMAAGRKILNGSPLAFGEGGMKERVKNVLKFKRRPRGVLIASAALAAALAVGLAVNRGAKSVSALPGDAPPSGTYALENPTEKQKLEKLASVTLYDDGRVWLKTPPISSYLLPDCYATVEEDELQIHANLGSETEEDAFGVKNGDVIARFAIADDKTLVFQWAGVPVFADKGARYVYRSDPPPTSAFETREWLDYYFDEEIPWGGSAEIGLREYPDTLFRWTPERVTAIGPDGEKELFPGMPVWSVYLADLTGDGRPELCATVSMGSGIVNEYIIVHDYAAGKTYALNDRGYYNYALFLDNGRLLVKQRKHPESQGDALAVGELAIVDGELTALGIDRTGPEGEKQRAMTLEDVRALAKLLEGAGRAVPPDLSAALALFKGEYAGDAQGRSWTIPIAGGRWNLEIGTRFTGGAEELVTARLSPDGFPFRPGDGATDLRKGFEDYIACVEGYDGSQTTLTGGEERDARSAARAYEEKLFSGRTVTVERITEPSAFDGMVIVDRVKGKVAAFTVEVAGVTPPPRKIVLTQTGDGGWEVINEGW